MIQTDCLSIVWRPSSQSISPSFVHSFVHVYQKWYVWAAFSPLLFHFGAKETKSKWMNKKKQLSPPRRVVFRSNARETNEATIERMSESTTDNSVDRYHQLLLLLLHGTHSCTGALRCGSKNGTDLFRVQNIRQRLSAVATHLLRGTHSIGCVLHGIPTAIR